MAVDVLWTAFTPDEWAEPVAPDVVAVVAGLASVNGEPVVEISGGMGATMTPDSFVDAVLSPQLDALLDHLVGPLAWKRVG